MSAGAVVSDESTNINIITARSLIGGKFNLIDQTGNSVTEKTYLGKYSLVFFGFTHCPNVCPLGLQRMIAALQKIDGFEAQITPIFISVDPERDSPQRMQSYLKNFHPSIVGLTGTEVQLENVARVYRAYFSKSQDPNSENYTYDHSSIMYLMNAQGKYVTHFADTTPINEMAALITNNLNKK
jgi:cytochrome oxidase Cu insertion factor (SCO1/SenC/PrrC family)